MSELQVGNLLKRRYRIDEKLGEGGMAVVYRAYDFQRRVMVALKLLKPDYAEDTEFVHRFRREAHNLQRLSHPHIVRFYEFEEEGESAFMVLDYIDGPTLRRIMRQRGKPFSPGEVLAYLRPVCSALSYAHSEKVVHCDMKPANVMLDHTGRVYVNDFGIARLSESATVTFSTPGTAAYMAPEQWRSGDEVYPATDVYAMGIMLHEMLVGKQPYTGSTSPTRGHNREKIMWEHLHAVPDAPSKVNSSVPSSIDKVIFKCLEKDWSFRYQAADELLAAFESACHQAGAAEISIQLPPVAPTATIDTPTTHPNVTSEFGIATPRGVTTPTGTPQIGATLARRPTQTGIWVMGIGAAAVVLLVGGMLLGGRGASGPATATQEIDLTAASIGAASAIPVAPVATSTTTATPSPSATPEPVRWKIAFTSDQSGEDAVWAMEWAPTDRAGQNTQQTTDPPIGSSDWYPEWCNANSKLLFERGDHVSRGSQFQTIYEIRPGARTDAASEWVGALGVGKFSGVVSCPTTGNEVLFGAAGETTPWMPMFFDGMLSTRFGTNYERIGWVALDGTGTRTAFSLWDGVTRPVAFKLFKSSLSDQDGAININSADIDSVSSFSWSPNGTQLAIVCQLAGSTTRVLCLTDSNGNPVQDFPQPRILDREQQRGDLSSSAGHPTWSPDGRWLAYASNVEGDWDIYVLDMSNYQLSAINLTAGLTKASDGSASNDVMPAWSK
jgi:serine/threonine protein kinase